MYPSSKNEMNKVNFILKDLFTLSNFSLNLTFFKQISILEL